MRNILHSTAFVLLSASSSFSAGVDVLDGLSKSEQLAQLSAHVPEIARGVTDLTARTRMCNYFKHVFDDGRSFDDKILDSNSSQEFIQYKQCCPTTGSSQVGMFADILAGEDPLPAIPGERHRQIKQTEIILRGLVREHDYAPVMHSISEQIRQTSDAIDSVACTPLAATYSLIQSTHDK